ncbi:SPOR domain-containing protein [Pseudomonas sp. LABIM340]|uniref:SPOR domain-containing protein n=1 Tax=Pseudomonas nitroreducens TaxID=46680 RepID=A0A5R9A0W8_PSENT|nr:SPOR domain-containing protein [Pseudomonas nitroreducens]TLP72150.1 SPOR domain-containing protein [Pseudomonas nitroreducens]
MALLDKGLKQRVVGALVLLALAVIFLPMLFSREDDVRQVVVEAPVMPKPPAMPTVEVQPTEVPEPQADDADNAVPPAEAAPAQAPSAPIASVPTQQAQPTQPKAPAPQPVAPKPAAPAQQPAQAAAAPVQQPAQRLDSNNLPVSWSVQLASLSNRARADELQKSLRSQGYNAYVRSFDGMNRVFVGPVVERAEADRLRDQLGKQQKLNGFVVRFQPERG